MAILSDASLLLSHTKHCFIYGDDTGLCEMIIEKELIGNYDLQAVLNNKFCIDIIDTSTTQFRNHSPEISIVDSRSSFCRKLSSDTRIKEVEEEKARIPDNHRFIDTGLWPRYLDQNDIEELFQEVKIQPRNKTPVKSLLSKMLEKTDQNDYVTHNIFSQYARFSALSYSKSLNPQNKVVQIISSPIPDSDPNKVLKDFNVYFWDYTNQRDRLNPVIIKPMIDAKVSDFIGLACWKYTDENRSPSLVEKSAVNKFQLYMFEDVDDLDLDFGSLHRDDPIYKYQFTNLAILECMPTGRRKMSTTSVITLDSSFVTHSHIERLGQNTLVPVEVDTVNDRNSTSNSSDFTDDSVLVQVQLAHGLSKFRLQTDTTVEQIIQRTMSKRNLQQHGTSYRYRLELASDPGKELDSNKMLGEISDPTFILIRDLSRRKPAIPDAISEESSDLLNSMFDSLQPQTYKVYLKQTLRRSEAILKISGDSVVIDVTFVKVPFLIKPKRVLIPVPYIADCVMDTHGQAGTDNVDGKTTLKIVHLKRKSALVKVLKLNADGDGSGHDSESSSVKSTHGRNDVVCSSTVAVPLGDLSAELTSHSVSCQRPRARLIHDQLVAILNLKSSVIRREFLRSLK